MKPSKALRLAAQWLEKEAEAVRPSSCCPGACLAICCVSDDKIDGYNHTAGPMKTMVDIYGEGRRGYWWATQGPRIIGLCLAAAIAESEGQ